MVLKVKESKKKNKTSNFISGDSKVTNPHLSDIQDCQKGNKSLKTTNVVKAASKS